MGILDAYLTYYQVQQKFFYLICMLIYSGNSYNHENELGLGLLQ